MRKVLSGVLLMIGLVLGLTGAARAGAVLFTPPMSLFGGTDDLSCEILNVSAHPRTVVIEVLDTSGTLHAQCPFGGGTLTIAPARSYVCTAVDPNATVYCKFTTSSMAKDYRAVGSRFGGLTVIQAQ